MLIADRTKATRQGIEHRYLAVSSNERILTASLSESQKRDTTKAEVGGMKHDESDSCGGGWGKLNSEMASVEASRVEAGACRGTDVEMRQGG